MSNYDPAKIQLFDDRIGKFLPGHAHGVLVEMDENDVFDPVAAADDLLSAQGAVDEGDFLSENESIRMDVKAEHGRDPVDLRRPLPGLVEQRAVPDMNAVKEAQRDRSLDF